MPKREEHIGDKLLAAIKAKGVTQAEVARHFKVAAATVSSDWIKHGRIAKKHIPGLVDYFGMPYPYWLGLDADAQMDQSALTQEERQVLSLMKGIRKEARDAWIKIGGYLSGQLPERRKEDIGYQPDRRRHFGILEGKRVPKPKTDSKLKRDQDNDG